MKTLIAVWKWSGLWRWRETRVCRWGFSTPWLVLWASIGRRHDLTDTRPRFRYTPEVDWSARPQATHHRLVLDRLFVLVVVPWDNWLHSWFRACQESASEAAVAHYWNWHDGLETGLLRRSYQWGRRWAYTQAFLMEAPRYWALPLRCWWSGHEYESWADAENGTEDVECRRCGDGFHAQF